jgi:hypothetical protein
VKSAVWLNDKFAPHPILPLSKYHLRVDFDFEFSLICLISSLKDYRLCWHINRLLSIQLARQNDLEVTNMKKRQVSYFNQFHFVDEINFLHYSLIGNKSSGAYLLPELKQVDYLLMLRGDAAGETTAEIVQQLKTLAGIEALFEANPAELRSKQNLILE